MKHELHCSKLWKRSSCQVNRICCTVNAWKKISSPYVLGWPPDNLSILIL
jgi:hypothetical protein